MNQISIWKTSTTTFNKKTCSWRRKTNNFWIKSLSKNIKKKCANESTSWKRSKLISTSSRFFFFNYFFIFRISDKSSIRLWRSNIHLWKINESHIHNRHKNVRQKICKRQFRQKISNIDDNYDKKNQSKTRRRFHKTRVNTNDFNQNTIKKSRRRNFMFNYIVK